MNIFYTILALNSGFQSFLNVIIGIIVFIIVLGANVAIHEAGHFYFAKKAGILCHEYAIGMGPVLKQIKKGETTYSIRAIPIGGFVSMAGEEIDSDVLSGVSKVKIKFNENNEVSFICANITNQKYADLETYEVLSYDLIGTKEEKPHELFIELRNQNGEVVKYDVAKDCMLNLMKTVEVQNAPYNRNFNNKPLGKRFMSVVAGPLMNFVFAILVFFILGLSFGYVDTSSTKIKDVEENTPAYIAGLRNDDVVASINGVETNSWDELSSVLADAAKGDKYPSTGYVNVEYYVNGDRNNKKSVNVYPKIIVYSVEMVLNTSDSNEVIIGDFGAQMDKTKIGLAGLKVGDKIISIGNTPISTYKDVLKYFNDNKGGKPVKFTVKRGDEVITKDVETYSVSMLDASGVAPTKVMLGVAPGKSRNFVKLLYMPFVETANSSMQIFKTIGLLFNSDSGVHVTDLSGPVGIVNLFTQIVSGDDVMYNILYWTALLSVNLGIINLLPLPALDGGRIVFLAYEAITKKKPNAKVEGIVNLVGFGLLMLLTVVILFSDVIKVFFK